MARQPNRLSLLAVIAAKSQQLIAVLKFSKFAGMLASVASMMVSLVSYDLIMGPWLALGLIGLLFVHEMGHVIAMRLRGLRTSWPVFIPFLGALIFAHMEDDHRETEAFVGYGGPFLGSVAAFLCYAAWAITGSQALLAITMFGLFLNLFNLIPVRPMDGGRILQLVFGDKVSYVGFVILIGYFIAIQQPGLLMIVIIMLSPNMPRWWWRSATGLVLLSIMISMFAVGYNDQPRGIDVMDVAIASFFLTGYVMYDKRRWRPPVEASRPLPSIKVRIGWCLAYGVLAGMLMDAMIRIASALPS